jgi:hypothetical protein
VSWIRKRREPVPPAPQPVSISGIRNSAVAVGTANYVVQGSSVEAGPLASQLDAALSIVRALVQAQAGSRTQDALDQVDQLEGAVTADPPDLTVIARVRGWFERNLPVIAPVVLEVAAHPGVDSVVKAAAQIAQARYRPEDGSAGG